MVREPRVSLSGKASLDGEDIFTGEGSLIAAERNRKREIKINRLETSRGDLSRKIEIDTRVTLEVVV